MANMGPPKSLMGQPQMGLIERILGGQSPYNTPGINPAAPSPSMPSAPPAGGFLGTPGGSFLMNLLAQSGYSTMPQSPLGAIGRAGVATQQQQMQQQQADLRTRILEQQLGVGRDPFQRLNVSDFTTDSVGRFQKSGNYSDLVLRDRQSGDPSAVAEWRFFQDLTPEEQEQYLRVKRAPWVENVPGAGVVTGSQNDPTRTRTVIPEETITRGQQERAEAQASGQSVGQARGAQAGKGPVLESFKVAAQSVRDAQKNVASGGFLGLRGGASRVVDYQDSLAFNNAVQQLSTELRTVFRIPGEGTLSDKEQEQYSLQLPSLSADPEVNERILSDLEARINARLTTDIGSVENGPSADDIAKKYLDGN